MVGRSFSINFLFKKIYAAFLELFARFMDWLFGEGPCDNFRMLIFNIWLFNHYAGSTDATKPLLFNIQDDPEEKFDLADKLPGVVEDLMKDVDTILKKRPKPPKYWLISRNWTDGFVPGNCDGQGTAITRNNIASSFSNNCRRVEVNLLSVYRQLVVG